MVSDQGVLDRHLQVVKKTNTLKSKFFKTKNKEEIEEVSQSDLNQSGFDSATLNKTQPARVATASFAFKLPISKIEDLQNSTFTATQNKRRLIRWGADGNREWHLMNSSRFEDDGISHSIGSQYSLETEDRYKLKQILQRVLYCTNNNKQWFELDDMVEEKPVKLEDPNPEYQEGIFFVAVRNWGQILRCRERKVSVKICVYDAKPLFIFSYKSRIRQLIVNITESTEFQNFTILVILLTTVTLIIYDYTDRGSTSRQNQILDKINIYSTYFYLFEFMMKIVTQGVFLHRNSYFRDGWNWLDFLVVFSGLSEITSMPNVPVKGMRAFRVIRPLRSIRQFPRLRKLISGLISSLPPLLNALLFMFFVFMQFSIFASYQFAGAYYNRCRLPGGVVDGVWPIDPTQHRLCSKTGNGYTCLNGSVCGEPKDVGLHYSSDPLDIDTDFRITNFDNPLIGLLTIFQCITFDGWSTMMYNIKDQQEPALVIIFFVLLIVVGAFFLIHMILAVISYSISQFETKELEDENLEKKNLAISLKRREKQLKVDDQQEELQEHIETLTPQEMNAFNAGLTHQDLQEKEDTQREVFSEQPIEENLFPKIEMEVASNFYLGSKVQQIERTSTKKYTDTQTYFTEDKLVQDSTDREEQNNQSVKPQAGQQELPARTLKNKLYLYSYKVCMDPLFSVFFTIITIVNAFIMTLDRFPEPQNLNSLLDLLNQICSWLFTVEMIIKIIGLGPVEYARDSFNLFDSLIVIMSLIDIVMFSISGIKIGSGVIVLRSIRLLRIFKLARNWTSFRILLSRIINTMPNIVTFGFLLGIIIAVFTILGMQFFGGTVYFDRKDRIVSADQGAPTLNNFENLYNATTSVFVVMLLDNWHHSMFDYYRGLGIGVQLYYVTTIAVLHYILLNLFLALIIENFDDQDESNDHQDSDQVKFYILKLFNVFRYVCNRLPIVKLKQSLNSWLQTVENFILAKLDEKQAAVDPIMTEISRKMEIICQQNVLDPELMRERVKKELESLVNARRRQLSIASQVFRDSQYAEEVKNLARQPSVIEGTTLFFFYYDHPIRKLCGKIHDHRFFDNLSNLVVVINTILLAVDNPLDDPQSGKQNVLRILDYVTTGIFSLEAMIKIILFGFLFNGSQSYLRLPWNVLDFVVVGVSIFSYLPTGADLQFYKAMRMLRILRPLRMIQRNQGLRIAVKSLINMLPGIFSLVMISCLNIGLMAVLGVNLFMGTFYRCNLKNIPGHHHQEIANMWDCLDHGGEWVNAEKNFDNFLQAFITVFQVSNVENWYRIAVSAQQTTAIFQTPKPMASPATIIFFVIVILIQAVFMFNLFVQVVVSIFNLEKEKLSHSTYLTSLEYEYIDTCIRCYKISPQKVFKSTQRISKLCYQLTSWKVFQHFIFVCILLNSLLLGLNWYGQSQVQIDQIEIANKILVGIFTLEIVLKVVAHRLDFFKDGWNLLDLAVVFFGILGYVIELLVGNNYTLAVTIIRMFKVTRLFKLVRALKQLQQITMTFIESLGEILNIGSLLFLFLFMFVILAMNLFSRIKLQTYINYDVNFQQFGIALLTLFRASTGEDWNDLMEDLSRQNSIYYRCKREQTFEQIQLEGIQGCGSSLTYAFFTLFQVVMSFIMFNLFTAIILEGFSKELLNETQRLKPETLLQFQLFWQKYDPDATGMIRLDDLEQLILDLTELEMNLQRTQANNFLDDEILFNFRHKKVLKLSAIWRTKHNDGSKEYSTLQNSVFFQRQLKRSLQRFIGELHIPTYNKIKFFNFYDVIQSFVDFQFSQRHKQEYQIRQDLKSQLKISLQITPGANKVALFSKEYFNLPISKKEMLFEKEFEDFVHVIHSIEEKSQRQDIQILKLLQLKELKRRTAKRFYSDLDNFNGKIIDSNFISAVRVIERAVLQYREKHAHRQQKPQIKLQAEEQSPIYEQKGNNKMKKNLKIMPEYVWNFKNHKLPTISQIGDDIISYLRRGTRRDSLSIARESEHTQQRESGLSMGPLSFAQDPFNSQAKQISESESNSESESLSGRSSSKQTLSKKSFSVFDLKSSSQVQHQDHENALNDSFTRQDSHANSIVAAGNSKQNGSRKVKRKLVYKIKQIRNQGKLKAETVKVYGNLPEYAHFARQKQRPIQKVFHEIAQSHNRWKILNAQKRLGVTKLGPAPPKTKRLVRPKIQVSTLMATQMEMIQIKENTPNFLQPVTASSPVRQPYQEFGTFTLHLQSIKQ